MGEIFLGQKAREEGGRYVALKSLRQDLTRDKEYVTRFLDEARVAIILNHPGINKVFDVGFAEGTYFLELEYVSGRDVRSFLERARDLERPIPPEIAYFLVGEILEALAYLHEARDISGIQLNLVHRDVSPQNVMTSWDGDITLIDFGLARFAARRTETEPGMVMGKLRYMAPEQARGGKLDRRVDLFAVGVVLYEMLSGRRLYEDVDPATLWEVVARGRALEGVRFERLPKETHSIVRRALAVDPGDRYPSGGALLADVRNLAKSPKPVAKKALAELLADLFEVDLGVEHEFMDELGRIAPFDLSTNEGTMSVSLADPSAAIPAEPSTSNPFDVPMPTTQSAPRGAPLPVSFSAGDIATQETAVTTSTVALAATLVKEEVSVESGPFSPVTEPAFLPEQADKRSRPAATGTVKVTRAPAGEPVAAVHGRTAPAPVVSAETGAPVAAAEKGRISFSPSPTARPAPGPTEETAKVSRDAISGAPPQHPLADEQTMLMQREATTPDGLAAADSLEPPPRRSRAPLLAAAALLIVAAGGTVIWQARGENAIDPDGMGLALAAVDGGAGVMPPLDVELVIDASHTDEVRDAAAPRGADLIKAKPDPAGKPDQQVVDAADGDTRMRGKKRVRPIKRRGKHRPSPVKPVPQKVEPPPPKVDPAPTAPVSEPEPRPPAVTAASRAQVLDKAKRALKRKGLTIAEGSDLWPSARVIFNDRGADEQTRQAALRQLNNELAGFKLTRGFVGRKLSRVQRLYASVRPRLDQTSDLFKDLEKQRSQVLKAYSGAGKDPGRLAGVNKLLNQLELRVKLASR